MSEVVIRDKSGEIVSKCDITISSLCQSKSLFIGKCTASGGGPKAVSYLFRVRISKSSLLEIKFRVSRPLNWRYWFPKMVLAFSKVKL